ncbi:MAG: glycosyltransferase family 4 protein [bacterium]|nr:glycosyltransferase family 4 protein [bacterium]
MATPIHVAIAVLSGTTGGPATYGRRLVTALDAQSELRVTVLTDAPAHFEHTNADIVHVPMRGGFDRLRWQHLAVPRELRRLRPDVYHDTKNALPRRLAVPAVVTVHDLAYYTRPETFGFASRWFLRRATRDAARRAAGVIVPSEATATDVRRYFSQCQDRLAVVPHGIDPAPTIAPEARNEVRARLRLPQHYVLHVGTIQARKNVDLVIAGVRELRRRGHPHRAVIVGRKGWLADSAVAEIERDDTALWLPHLSATDLATVYAEAGAFVSPSAYEGFGFAVADALAAGVPTVIANVSSLPELCGDAAVRLDDLSAAAVTSALTTIVDDAALTTDLRERGRARAAEFSWARCAAQHADVYRKVAATAAIA